MVAEQQAVAETLNNFSTGTTRTETSQEMPTPDSSRITDHISKCTKPVP